MGWNPSTLSLQPSGPFPWRPRFRDLLGIVCLYAVVRLVLVLVGMLAWNFQVSYSSAWRGLDHQTRIYYALVPNQPLLDMWCRWDSWQYDEIARQGYWYDFNLQPSPYGTVACFPLYSLFIKGLGTILGGQAILAALVISNLSAIAGLVILFQWVTWWGDRKGAWLAVASAMAFPAGLFWSALYPQSLYFALSVGSLALMLDGRIAWSCLVCGLATATRLEAVSLIPALLLIRIARDGFRPSPRDLWFLVTPMGLAGYMAYLQAKWGDPLLFLRVHALFGRALMNPLETLLLPIKEGTATSQPVVLGTYLVVLLVAWGHLTRVRWPVLVYGWLLLAIPLSSGVYLSIYRVHLVNLVIYLVIGLGFRGRWIILGWVVVLASLVVEARVMFLWVTGYFLP